MRLLKQSLKCAFILTIVIVFGQIAVAAKTSELAPVNPEFLEDMSPARNVVKALATDSLMTGWVPSPISPEVHQVYYDILTATLSDPIYDLRDPDSDGDNADSVLPPVKNQGTCGSCWSFATYGTLESLLKKQTGAVNDFSENHLKQLHGFDPGPCDGGNIQMSSAYFSRYHGVVTEAEDSDDQTATKQPCITCSPSQYVDSAVFMPVKANVNDNDYIKQALMDHGALYVSFFWSSGAYTASDYTYYYTGSGSNHAVVVVGWDDTKITAAAQPGAFIVRNSWGDSWGENGYFYVSYYDTSFAFRSLGYIDDHKNDTPKKVYFHDTLGMTGAWGYGDGEDWGANVFTPDEDGIINAVSFYATASGLTYEVFIYDEFNKNPVSFTGQLGTTVHGSVDHMGYYTVRLAESVPVTAGNSFGVVVKFTTPGYIYSIPLERPIGGYSSAAEASPDESFISDTGSSWEDLTSQLSNSNVCIKALEFVSTKGDVDNDGSITLADSVLSLQIITGLVDASLINISADVNGDNKIGVAEVVYVLQHVSGIR